MLLHFSLSFFSSTFMLIYIYFGNMFPFRHIPEHSSVRNQVLQKIYLSRFLFVMSTVYSQLSGQRRGQKNAIYVYITTRQSIHILDFKWLTQAYNYRKMLLFHLVSNYLQVQGHIFFAFVVYLNRFRHCICYHSSLQQYSTSTIYRCKNTKKNSSKSLSRPSRQLIRTDQTADDPLPGQSMSQMCHLMIITLLTRYLYILLLLLLHPAQHLFPKFKHEVLCVCVWSKHSLPRLVRQVRATLVAASDISMAFTNPPLGCIIKFRS